MKKFFIAICFVVAASLNLNAQEAATEAEHTIPATEIVPAESVVAGDAAVVTAQDCCRTRYRGQILRRVRHHRGGWYGRWWGNRCCN